MTRRWRVDVTPQAWADLDEILFQTALRFGARQSAIYETTLAAAIASLEGGPSTLGVKRRDDVKPGLLMLHVARKRRRGRHFICFRVGPSDNQRTVEVLRILYDGMDFAQHFGEQGPGD